MLFLNVCVEHAQHSRYEANRTGSCESTLTGHAERCAGLGPAPPDAPKDRRLDDLSKEASKLFESKLKELEEDEVTYKIDDAFIKELGVGLHIIPPEIKIEINKKKTFSIILKHSEEIDPSWEISITSNNPQFIKVGSSSVKVQINCDDGTIVHTPFSIII